MKQALFALSLLLTLTLGMYLGTQAMKYTAIENGVAYYTVNPTNGNITFVWKKCPQE